MVFTIEEIKRYLVQQKNIDEAIKNLNEQAIIDDFSSLNYVKNEVNLLKYEVSIGMRKRKEEQKTLYQNTNGKKGRYWLACKPKWIVDDIHRKNTEYEIRYWVNYGDDTTYGYGWFTVEQIIEWFDNPNIYLHELGGKKER